MPRIQSALMTHLIVEMKSLRRWLFLIVSCFIGIFKTVWGVCACVFGCTCAGVCVWREENKQLLEGFLGSKSDFQVWWHVSLPTESSFWRHCPSFLCIPGWVRTHYVDQTGLKFMELLLPLLSKCCNCGHLPPHELYSLSWTSVGRRLEGRRILVLCIIWKRKEERILTYQHKVCCQPRLPPVGSFLEKEV